MLYLIHLTLLFMRYWKFIIAVIPLKFSNFEESYNSMFFNLKLQTFLIKVVWRGGDPQNGSREKIKYDLRLSC